MVNNPLGHNAGLYRIGHRLAGDGTVRNWYPWILVPDWGYWENQGVGVAAANLDSDGRPELIVFALDNPPGKRWLPARR